MLSAFLSPAALLAHPAKGRGACLAELGAVWL
jgi:hypothetical protein